MADFPYPVETRDVPEQFVLTETYYGAQGGLVPWMGEAFGRLWSNAAPLGSITGPVFAVYHGEITPEQSGTVEACGPLAPGTAVPDHLDARRERAHREAYVSIPKRMVEFPQILDAYSAVETWITANGHTIAAAPREVYLHNFMDAGPDDLACEIAFPIR